MRWKISTGLLLVLALLIPASPASAQPESPRPNAAACEAPTFRDIREFLVDPDTATDLDIRILVNQMSSVARNESLTSLFQATQDLLRNGTAADLRDFVRTTWTTPWAVDLRIATVRTIADEVGPHVQAAANAALTAGTLDSYLTYLNHELHVARALDAGWPVTTFRDIREFLVDPDTATDLDIRILVNQMSSVARNESLTSLFQATQDLLRNGTAADLRDFVRTTWTTPWAVDLRIATVRTIADEVGPHVQAAADTALNAGTLDSYLTYLNSGLYAARYLDSCTP
ncbi:hypothetical protein BLA60_32945 [Actinophytocola xinjiangensis]|uniref:Uncharacterized protein n=1 Tax=Actinophytocola xinjiangensis TaxID=485602 RepID=A0A7Z0WGN9_9PSEU|nr:ALF repeat-containing protein [Actinophytocola xinjiangensis]OLF06147.1 hypothetical protein BLA60_32945 [Actinophytocola xinjiangensis]